MQEGNVLEKIREVRRRVQADRRRIDTLADSLLDTDIVLETVARELTAPDPPQPRQPGPWPVRKVRAGGMARRPWDPSAVVSAFEWRPQADGTGWFRVNATEIKLSPLLSDLLCILAMEKGHSDDEAVGFKSCEELAAWLGKKGGRTFNKHAIAELTRRLRVAFLRAGLDPWLIQTHRRLGRRLNRKLSPLIGSGL